MLRLNLKTWLIGITLIACLVNVVECVYVRNPYCELDGGLWIRLRYFGGDASVFEIRKRSEGFGDGKEWSCKFYPPADYIRQEEVGIQCGRYGDRNQHWYFSYGGRVENPELLTANILRKLRSQQ